MEARITLLTILPAYTSPATYDTTYRRLVSLLDHPDRTLWSPLDVLHLALTAAGDLDVSSLSEPQTSALTTLVTPSSPAACPPHAVGAAHHHSRRSGAAHHCRHQRNALHHAPPAAGATNLYHQQRSAVNHYRQQRGDHVDTLTRPSACRKERESDGQVRASNREHMRQRQLRLST